MPASAVREAAPPAWFTHPPFTSSIGDDVADWCASLKLASGEFFVPDDNQRAVLRAMFAGPPGVSYATRDRKWLASQVALVAPRQNIKTSCLEMAAAAAFWLLDARLIVWTAHLYNPAAAETFLHFKELVEANPHLSRHVRRIRETTGGQGLDLMSGARIKFQARSRNAGRSLSGDVIVMDEAYQLSTEEAGALIPTRSARPNSQIWYGSSAGHLDSTQLRLIRDRGRPGTARQVYAEWASTAVCDSPRCTHDMDAPGCVLDDEDQWHAANPALGIRIDLDTVRDERRQMVPAMFARERLGWWDEPAALSAGPIPVAVWDSLAGTGGIAGPVCVGVDVLLDRSGADVAVCGAADDPDDPRDQVELLTRVPTSRVAETLTALLDGHDVEAVGVRSAGPVLSLVDSLELVCEESGVPFDRVGASDFAGMCGAFHDAAHDGKVRHLGDPRLRDAVHAGRAHKVLDAWTWERTAVDTDAAPLVAATVAHGLWRRHAPTDDDDIDITGSVL